MCTDPPETPLRVVPWQWAMAVLCALAGVYGSYSISHIHLKPLLRSHGRNLCLSDVTPQAPSA